MWCGRATDMFCITQARQWTEWIRCSKVKYNLFVRCLNVLLFSSAPAIGWVTPSTQQTLHYLAKLLWQYLVLLIAPVRCRHWMSVGSKAHMKSEIMFVKWIRCTITYDTSTKTCAASRRYYACHIYELNDNKMFQSTGCMWRRGCFHRVHIINSLIGPADLLLARACAAPQQPSAVQQKCQFNSRDN